MVWLEWQKALKSVWWISFQQERSCTSWGQQEDRPRLLLPLSIFSHQKVITHCEPITKWERGLKSQSLSLKRRNKHVKHEGTWKCVMCFPLWPHPCSQGLIIHPDFLYIHRNKPFLCVRLRPKLQLPGTIRLRPWAHKNFPALRLYDSGDTLL